MGSKRSFQNFCYDLRRFISLDAFTSKDYGMSDLILPIAFCDDESIILNKDGSFTWSFWYSGADFDSSSDEDLDYLNSHVYSRAFAFLGDGWSMHLRDDSISTSGYIPQEQCYFPDPTTQCMDTERRFRYESTNKDYINKFVISFHYLPPSDNKEKVGNWFMEDSEDALVEYVEHLNYFKSTVNQVLEQLSYQVYTKALTKPETRYFFHRCINGFGYDYKEEPNSWLDLCYRLATQDFVKGFVPIIGDYKIGIVSVGEGLPVKATPGLLHELTTLDFEYSWITRFIFLDKETAKKLIDKTAEYHYQSRQSIKQSLGNKNRSDGTQRINRSADTLANQAEDALERLELEVITYGKYSSSIIVFDKDEKSLDTKLEQIQKILSSRGFLAKRERAQCTDAYFATIPGMVRNNVRKWVMDTINLADIMPTTDVWAGYEKNPSTHYGNNNPPTFYSSTRDGSTFRGCTYVDDIGHSFIVGPSRGGKSVLVNFLAAQEFRYKNAQIFHYDYGYSGQILNFACNGSHFDITSQLGSLNFKPLSLLDDSEDFSFLVQWLCEIAEVNLNRIITADEKSSITRVLEIIKAQGTPEQRSMTYFYLQLKAHAKNNELAEAFVGYTASSAKSTLKSKIFNAPTDQLKFNNFCMFEMEKLMKMSNDIFIPTIRYLFYMNYRALDGRPTTIFIEECQAFAKHKITLDMIDDALRRYAKKGCRIILITQQVNDILKSDLWDVIQDQCKTKIFLSNPSILTNDQTPDLYRQFGLNQKQIEIIGHGIPKREYYFTNLVGSRLFDLELQQVALAFLSKTNPADLNLARQIKNKVGPLFGYHWLKHCELHDVADYWLQIYKQQKVN